VLDESAKTRETKRRKRSSSPQPSLDTALQLHLQGRTTEAESAYRRLIAADPQNANAWYLLSRLLHQLEKRDEAIETIRSALAIRPEDRQALNDLGLMQQEAGDLEDATACFTRLIELDPSDANATNNLGIVLKSQDLLEQASARFAEAAALDPQNADAECNLGNVRKTLQDPDGAAAAYRRALAINPGLVDVYPNLTAVLRRQGKMVESLQVLSQWLEHEPDHPVARHLQATGTSHDTPARASEDYVRAVFDEFAETFDQELRQLEYRASQLIGEALQRDIPAQEPRFDILDAGCGTGLCGDLLKPYARRLVGVDLSSKMLDRARQLELYDALAEADLVVFLDSRPSLFDVIVSSDTFGYFGDLQPAFAAVRQALKPDGLLVCTVELEADEAEHTAGYRLMTSGRYRHTRTYVESVLQANQFVTRSLDPGTLRLEAGRPVECLVVRAIRG
jgi:predicted TPR repeat methyltransferase